MKKIVAAGLGLSILLSGVSSNLPAFSNEIRGVAYAANTNYASIYDQYDIKKNEDGKYRLENDFYYNGKEYREDILDVNINQSLRDQTINEVKEFRRWAFDNIKQYKFNSDTEQVEYRTIAEWKALNDEDGQSIDALREEFANDLKWDSYAELLALQDAYRKFTLDPNNKDSDVKEYFDKYLYGKDSEGKSLIDKYNDYQENYVKEVLVDHYNQPRGNDSDLGVWSGVYVAPFSDDNFIALLEKDIKIGLGKASNGSDQYISFFASTYLYDEDMEVKDRNGSYKFHIGTKTNDDKSFEKTGQYHDILGYYEESIVHESFPYREDIFYLDQSIKLQEEVETAIRDARKKVFDEGIEPYGLNIRNLYKTSDVNKNLYASPKVYDSFNTNFITDRAHENVVNILIGKEYYIEEGKSPNGLESYSAATLYGSGIYRYSKDKSLNGEDFINEILYGKRENGKSAWDMIKEGVAEDDNSIWDAELLLSDHVQNYYITRIYTEDFVYYQLNHDSKYALFDRGDRNMSGLKGSYKFTMGSEGVDQKSVDKQRKELANMLFDSSVQNYAAKTLLEKAPKTITRIKDKLEKLVAENDELIREAFINNFGRVQMDEENFVSDGIVQMLRYKYDKKLATKEDKDLAVSLYLNLIQSKGAKTLLENTPKTVKSIEKELKEKVESSEKLVEDAINTLK